MRYAGRVTENFPVATAGASMLPAMGALLRRIHEDMSRAAVVFRAWRTRGGDYRPVAPAAPVVPAGPCAPIGPIGAARPYIIGKLLCPINEDKIKYSIITSICTV